MILAVQDEIRRSPDARYDHRAPWGVAGGGGNELSAGSRGARRFAWNGGELDSTLREVRLRRLERSGRPGPTFAAAAGAVAAGGDSLEAKSSRLRFARAALGRSALIEFSGEAMGG